MKNIILIGLLSFTFNLSAQVVKDYNPSAQRTTHMQYFKPSEERLFTGDCMPYFHNGVFYLYWLLDEGHHSGLEGLGGHQWALSTSTDLINWKHYPVALGIDNQEWEKSICTGSVIAEKDKFHAFYATRIKEDGKTHEQLSHAISDDGGLSYKKQKPNPFYPTPEECVSRDFRDPKVFKDGDGKFHLFVSGYLKEPLMKGYGGYLVHLISDDLENWQETESPLKGQRSTPECSDYFKWNDWYYLLFSVDGYTSYLKSREPYGPWEYPDSQVLSEFWSVVYKTAPFNDNRRIAVAYTPGRENDKNDGVRIWGGNAMFRELVQLENGTLGTRFLPEVLPNMKPSQLPGMQISSINNVLENAGTLEMDARGDLSLISFADLPINYQISIEVAPEGNYDELGLFIRTEGNTNSGYKLEVSPNKKTVTLKDTSINSVSGLDKPFTIDLIAYKEFIDVCINGERSILNRMPEYGKDKDLLLYLKNGKADIKNIKLYEIDDQE